MDTELKKNFTAPVFFLFVLFFNFFSWILKFKMPDLREVCDLLKGTVYFLSDAQNNGFTIINEIDNFI